MTESAKTYTRTRDGRLEGVPYYVFDGLSDAERKEATDLLMNLSGYRWWPTEGRTLFTPAVRLDVENVSAALREARRAVAEEGRSG